jgi:hypothetical protein
MSEKFENWKRDLENEASEVVEAPEEAVDQAIHDAAIRMGDVEFLSVGNRPIDKIIREFEGMGWHYRGSISAGELYRAVAEDKKEVTVIRAGDQRYVFERDKASHIGSEE